MAENRLNSRLLKESKVKPCRVQLKNDSFSKIRMACSATDEKNVKLICDLKQTGMNSFTIKINSKHFKEDKENKTPPSKKVKFSDSVNVHVRQPVKSKHQG